MVMSPTCCCSMREASLELREVDLVRAGPVEAPGRADLGADVLQEFPSLGGQPEVIGRRRGLDEPGVGQPLDRGGPLGVLRRPALQPAARPPPLPHPPPPPPPPRL